MEVKYKYINMGALHKGGQGVIGSIIVQTKKLCCKNKDDGEIKEEEWEKKLENDEWVGRRGGEGEEVEERRGVREWEEEYRF